MRKTVNIPSNIIEYANTKDIDEMLRILGDFVRYKITGKIECSELLDLINPNMSRAKKMMGNKNSVKQTKKQCETDSKTEGNSQQKQSETDKKDDCFTLISPSPKQPKPTDEDEALGIYISNNILLFNIVHDYIYSNIHYGNIQYLINTQGEKKYMTKQMKEAEKIIKEIGMDNFKAVLNFVHQDDFRSKQILSIAKLNRKNKEGVPYYIVMLDKIKQYTPKVYSIPTV